MQNLELSIVSPVYQADSCILQLVEELIASLKSITDDYEIILVNDASPDDSWEKIKSICKMNKKVKGLNLSRNFGQHKAIVAGLEHAKGRWIVVMDCDLQDRPDQLKKLWNKAIEGNHVVLASRDDRKDSYLKKLGSRLFYSVLSFMIGSKVDNRIANYGIYHRNVIHAILTMNDDHKYFPTMVQWVGFKRTIVSVAHSHRQGGKSSYSFLKLFELAYNNIIAFSNKPLKMIISFGFVIATFSVFLGVFYLCLYVQGRIEVLGYASLIVSIWFSLGINMMMIGVFGEYLGRVFDSVKKRPIYIVSDILN